MRGNAVSLTSGCGRSPATLASSLGVELPLPPETLAGWPRTLASRNARRDPQPLTPAAYSLKS